MQHRLVQAFTAIAATGSLVLAGCTHTPLGPSAPLPAAVAPTSPLSLAEKSFMAKAASRSLYELEVSKLAAERGSDARVREFARGLVGRQSQFTRELTELMSAKGVPPPAGLAPDKAAKLQKLAAVPPGAAFDNGYVRVVGIEDHQQNIAMLEQGRRIAADRDLRAWIDRQLPVLRRQLGVAQALAGSLAG